MLDQQVFEKNLRMIQNQALKLVPEWNDLPDGDAMKVIANFVASVSTSVEGELSNLEKAFTAKLPHIFGVRAKAAVPASGYVKFLFTDSLSKPHHLKPLETIRIEQDGRSLKFETSDAAYLLPGTRVRVEHEEYQSWIGVNRIPSGIPLQIFLLTRAQRKPIDFCCYSFLGEETVELAIQDHTKQLTSSGTLEFNELAGKSTPQMRFGENLHWIQIKYKDYCGVPFREALPNVVKVKNIRRHTQELLGSGQGTEQQTLALPPGQLVSCSNLLVYNASSAEREIWTRTDSFLLHTSTDRVFIYDSTRHELIFGDGVRGAILTPGYDNVWIQDLVLTDGQKGNVRPGAKAYADGICGFSGSVQLLEGTFGGCDADAETNLVSAMQAQYHHRDRAVTLRDYQDLAILSHSPLTAAKARCTPAGEIEVCIYRSAYDSDRKCSAQNLIPSTYDVGVAQSFLDDRRPLNTRLRVVRPNLLKYRLNIRASLRVAEDVNLGKIKKALIEYLSPWNEHGVRIEQGENKMDANTIHDIAMAIPGIESLLELEILDLSNGRKVPSIQYDDYSIPDIDLRLRVEEAQ